MYERSIVAVVARTMIGSDAEATAAGFIAGTTPTTGVDKTALSASSTIVDAVLHAITIKS